MYELYFIYPS